MDLKNMNIDEKIELAQKEDTEAELLRDLAQDEDRDVRAAAKEQLYEKFLILSKEEFEQIQNDAEMNEMEIYHSKEEMLDVFLNEYLQDRDVTGLSNIIKGMCLEGKDYLQDILNREDVYEIEVEDDKKFIYSPEEDFEYIVKNVRRWLYPEITTENIELSLSDTNYIEGIVKINDESYAFDMRLDEGLIEVHNYTKTHEENLPEHIGKHLAAMCEVIDEDVNQYIDEQTKAFVFDDELCVNDERCLAIDGYLWATDELVKRMKKEEGLQDNADELENINFYVWNDLESKTIEINGTYWLGDEQKEFKLPLTATEQVFLQYAMEKYCEAENGKSCLKFLNEVRQDEGLDELKEHHIVTNLYYQMDNDSMVVGEAELNLKSLKGIDPESISVEIAEARDAESEDFPADKNYWMIANFQVAGEKEVIRKEIEDVMGFMSVDDIEIGPENDMEKEMKSGDVVKNLMNAMAAYGLEAGWTDADMIDALVECGITKSDFEKYGKGDFVKEYFEEEVDSPSLADRIERVKAERKGENYNLKEKETKLQRDMSL